MPMTACEVRGGAPAESHGSLLYMAPLLYQWQHGMHRVSEMRLSLLKTSSEPTQNPVGSGGGAAIG